MLDKLKNNSAVQTIIVVLVIVAICWIAGIRFHASFGADEGGIGYDRTSEHHSR